MARNYTSLFSKKNVPISTSIEQSFVAAENPFEEETIAQEIANVLEEATFPNGTSEIVVKNANYISNVRPPDHIKIKKVAVLFCRDTMTW